MIAPGQKVGSPSIGCCSSKQMRTWPVSPSFERLIFLLWASRACRRSLWPTSNHAAGCDLAQRK
eukprot:4875504-Lingulodinium_polyedra.AAC.1